jgi:hypothetical protein
MKKFGFGKKSDGDDDSNRAALFGNKKGSPAPSANPYAQPAPANDPYTAAAPPMTGAQSAYKSYQNAPIGGGLPGGPRAGGLPGGPRGGGGLPGGPRGGGGLPGGPRGAPPLNRNASSASNETAPPPYNDNPSSSGYGSEKYGAASGYGSNRYDSSSAGAGSSQRARGGGYGGLGRTDSDDQDTNRDALFSGARERYDQRVQQPPPPQSTGSYGTSGAGSSAGYGGYGEQRELTAEEQEEQEVADVKRQIKETKLASANSAQNSERIAAQAVETALGTYARLGAQHERLNYTEGLLDKASISTREAEGQTRKLKSLNRSMFAVHVGNPFTSSKKSAEMEQKILEQSRADRDLREQTRKAGWQANQHMEAGFKEIEAERSTDKWQRASSAEKSKYQFEDDSEDEETENRIDESMARTANHVSTLNSVARLMAKEIDTQNEVIDRLGGKVRLLFNISGLVTNWVPERYFERPSQAQHRETAENKLEGVRNACITLKASFERGRVVSPGHRCPDGTKFSIVINQSIAVSCHLTPVGLLFSVTYSRHCRVCHVVLKSWQLALTQRLPDDVAFPTSMEFQLGHHRYVL